MTLLRHSPEGLESVFCAKLDVDCLSYVALSAIRLQSMPLHMPIETIEGVNDSQAR